MEIIKSLSTSGLELLILALSLWFYWLWTRRHLYSFALKFPGQLGLPLIGSFHSIGGPKHHFRAFAKFFRVCQHHTVCIWMGLYPVLLTAEPALIEQVLLSPQLLEKPRALYSPLDGAFGGGIITSPVEKWHRNRKLINPTFNHKTLLSFLPVFHKAKNVTLAKFDAMAGKGEQKLALLLQKILLEVSVDTTMGNEGHQIDANLAETFSTAADAVSIQALLAFANLDFIFTLYTRFIKSKAVIKTFVEELIIRKLKNFNQTQKSDFKTDSTEETPVDAECTLMGVNKLPKIFIDQAVNLYQKKLFNWEDLASESITIISAAFETTANGLFSTLIMLAMHPDVQEKLYEELLSVFPDKDFELKYEHMQQLPYLDMVLNEVLRLAPPVPYIARQVEQNIQLTKNLQLPAGLMIMIPIFNLHRRKDIWGANADKFNPDNFLPANIMDHHSHAFIPFSKGARNCIGWRYALFSLKTMIAGLVRNYRITTSYKFEDLQYSIKITLCYAEEPGLEIHRR